MSQALDEMLKLVADASRKECEAVAESAEREARELTGAAHRAARRRMHDSVLEIRQIMRRELNQAQAALETARRQHQQRCDFRLLEASWSLLGDALARRWQDAAARKTWIASVVRQAQHALPGGTWQVHYPADWPSAERERLAADLSAAGVTPQWIVDQGVSAGLRLCAQGACLDGTAEGILADRAAIQAQLLAKLNE
jgi:hypothetical protein